jgi:phosphopantothenoylcysteine synthetase/decarboxylase
MVPIDRVRGITNIFTGRTGAQIATEAIKRGHHAELLTSHPETAFPNGPKGDFRATPYQTFDDLGNLMEERLPNGSWDGFIHCAAVSDYRCAAVYGPEPGTQFHVDTREWLSSKSGAPRLADQAAGKVPSAEPELWLRLVRTPKLIDRVRSEWNFQGILVKFKLEVGVSEEKLLDIGERSRLHSRADLMVANTLEGKEDWALLGPRQGRYARVQRDQLAARLIDAVEELHAERDHD